MDFAFLYSTDLFQITLVMVRQKNRRILAQSKFFCSFETRLSEWPRIYLFNKETQSLFLYFRIQPWIFFKKPTLNFRTILYRFPPTKGSFTIWLGGRMISPPFGSVKTQIELSRVLEIESCNYIAFHYDYQVEELFWCSKI